ncbi:MAG TPA: polysaccharide deacetylase family protein [Firmicutes bacterium]|nr:polysaccharide deacetylase family protein [Bacillota bacterium]
MKFSRIRSVSPGVILRLGRPGLAVLLAVLLVLGLVAGLRLVVALGAAGADGDGSVGDDGGSHQELELEQKLRAELLARFQGRVPRQWGERVTGVVTRIDTTEKVVALTFDACGGSTPASPSNGYDRDLIDFLNREQIPATLFISSRWIDANPELFQELARNPLFTIENHGYLHRPLSVTGRSVYGVKGTASINEVIDEILLNQRRIEQLTGRAPRYFRSGTAYYDEVAVEIVEALGLKAIGFDILGDAGATFNKEQVKRALLGVRPGSIVLCHMNHPESDTAEGLMEAVPILKRMGFRFVRLRDYHDRLSAIGAETAARR